MLNKKIENNLEEQILKIIGKLPYLREKNDSKNYRNLLDLFKKTMATYLYTGFGGIVENKVYTTGTLKNKVELELEEITLKMNRFLDNDDYLVYRDWNICFNKLCDIIRYFN